MIMGRCPILLENQFWGKLVNKKILQHVLIHMSCDCSLYEEEWSNDWVPRKSTPDIHFRRVSLMFMNNMGILWTPHRQLCLLILPHKWRVASSEKIILSRYELSFSIRRSISAEKCALSGWLLSFMRWRSWILKVHKWRGLRMILWVVDLGIWNSVLTLRIDFRGLLANAILTRTIVSSFTDTFACLPVCGSNDPVSRSVLSHFRIALRLGGSTFHVRRIRRCTRVTDFSSASHNKQRTFSCDALLPNGSWFLLETKATDAHAYDHTAVWKQCCIVSEFPFPAVWK